MFGFSKKKDEANSAQSQAAAQMQTSKVEDDMATFEIPDFSDDDLNFDLGIGEFMPKQPLDLQEEPKGLPTNPAEKPNVAGKPEAPTIPSLLTIPADAPAETQALPKIQNIQENTQKEEPQEHDDDDSDFEKTLPKFSNQKPVDVLETVQEIEHPAKEKKIGHKKEAHHRQIVHKSEPKHYAQASPEGFFVPKDAYKKMVVLADDISKKSASGDDVSRSIHLMSKNSKETIFDADKDAKQIRDLMMSADLMLFGGK